MKGGQKVVSELLATDTLTRIILHTTIATSHTTHTPQQTLGVFSQQETDHYPIPVEIHTWSGAVVEGFLQASVRASTSSSASPLKQPFMESK